MFVALKPIMDLKDKDILKMTNELLKTSSDFVKGTE